MSSCKIGQVGGRVHLAFFFSAQRRTLREGIGLKFFYAGLRHMPGLASLRPDSLRGCPYVSRYPMTIQLTQSLDGSVRSAQHDGAGGDRAISGSYFFFRCSKLPVVEISAR